MSSEKATATAVTFKAVAGTQYDIAVDGFNGAVGNIVLNLAFAPDVTPPKVTITSPAAGANLTNASFLLQGKATDNVAVAQSAISFGKMRPEPMRTRWQMAPLTGPPPLLI